MHTLIVHNIEDEIAAALEARAAADNISIEAEHIKILTNALMKPKRIRKIFAEAVMSIPNAGTGTDFDRKQD